MEIRAAYDKLLTAIRNRRTRDKPRECCRDIGKSACAGNELPHLSSHPFATYAFDRANNELKFIQVKLRESGREERKINSSFVTMQERRNAGSKIHRYICGNETDRFQPSSMLFLYFVISIPQ